MLMMMTLNTIPLKARAWGCKIKSNVSAELSVEKSDLKLGEDIILKLSISFDPEDLPKSFELSVEEKQSHGFILESPIKVESEEIKPELTVDVSLGSHDAQMGDYQIDLSFRHAEFGTQLAEVQPVQFKLNVPEVEVLFCRADNPMTSMGQTVNIEVGLNSPAPQKIRGILIGRLISNDPLKHKSYELEPRRVSIMGEKVFTWQIQIPTDETKTGQMKAIIEFKSKDTFSKKEFENVIEIRRSKSIRVVSLNASSPEVSAGDALEITAELENSGLKPINFELTLEILNKEQKAKGGAEVLQWTLPSRNLDLAPDTKQQISWPFELPDNMISGKYLINLSWKDRASETAGEFSQELITVKKHHEVKILDVILPSGSFSVGSDADLKVQLSDSGTRRDVPLNIKCKVFDIFNTEIFQKSDDIRIVESKTEYEFHWPIPENLDAGRYDLLIQVIHNDKELVSRKFTKFINIELPVKLDIHSMVPSAFKDYSEFAGYLLENERVTNEIEHQSLSIYRLNSNTHIFLMDNDVITYSIDKKSSPEQLQSFGEKLYSYLVTREYFTSKNIRTELKFWLKMGYSWLNLLTAGEKFFKFKDSEKLYDMSVQKPTLALIADFSKLAFRNTFHRYSQKKVNLFRLSDIYQSNVTEDNKLTGTQDFKLITATMKYISEYSPKTGLHNLRTSKPEKSKKENKSIKHIEDLNALLKSSISKQVNSPLLQKKFNRIIVTLVNDLRKGRILRKPDNKIWQQLRSGYSYLLAYLNSEICAILKTINKNKYLSSSELFRLISFEIIYFYMLMNFYHSQSKYDPYLPQEKVTAELNMAFNELKKVSKNYWAMNNRWQTNCGNYLKNMSKRANLAFVREHIKITTNPVSVHGIRGAHGRTKLILGNNGSRNIGVQPVMALPSIHWNLVEPEARALNNIYHLNRIVINPKQTKEIPITVSFPRALSFQKYTGILKLNTKHIKLLPEIE
jgi:hypothetical protein